MKPSSSISVDFGSSGTALRPGKTARPDSREEQSPPGFSSSFESAVRSDRKAESGRQKIESSSAQTSNTRKQPVSESQVEGGKRQEKAGGTTGKEKMKSSDETKGSDEHDETASEGNENQIRADAEALLDRLNASSQQLQTAKDGKDLPPEAESLEGEEAAAALLAGGAALQSAQTGAKATEASEAELGPEADVLTAGRQGKLAQLLAAQEKTQTDPKTKTSDSAVFAGVQTSAPLETASADSKAQPEWLNEAIARLTASKGGEAGMSDGGSAGNPQSNGNPGLAAGMNAALADAGLQLDAAQTDSQSAATGAVSGQHQSLQTMAAGLQRADTAQAQQPPLPLQRDMAGEQLAERVQMLMSKNLKQVDIRLDPPELGRLQIKLHINNDQASVQFNVGNAQTRELVEHAMPRLRELLQQQGLQLAQSSVHQDSGQQLAGQHTGGQQQGEAGSSRGGQSGQLQSDEDVGNAVAMTVSEQRDGIDYYA
ncbi:flagellar hook-length control protein FliK [Photobacterium sp. R1]